MTQHALAPLMQQNLRNYLAVHLPLLPAECAIRTGRAPPDKPFALIEKICGAICITALSASALDLGLGTGMTLADARGRVPELLAFPVDVANEQALLARLARDCVRYTPSVTPDPPHGLLLDITGCEHLFRSAAALRADLVTNLITQGFTAHSAMGGTPDAARALAIFGGTDVRALPITALRVAPETHIALRRAGLKTIGDLASRPRAPLAARFGAALVTQLARLLGEEDAHLTPLDLLPRITADMRFPEPLGRTDDVMDVIEALLVQVIRQLNERGHGGRAFMVSLERSDGHIAQLSVETSAATRDVALVMRLFFERIESLADPLDPGFGYDRIRLVVRAYEPLGIHQVSLGDTTQKASDVNALIDRLVVRFGAAHVQRFAFGDSHVPEYAGYLCSIRANDSLLPPAAKPINGFTGSSSDPPTRPVTLFTPPQRIEVLAQVPDGPPRRFRWRGAQHLITSYEGPERIAYPWWLRRGGYDDNRGLSRDYFRVEDEQGRRFWVFRHGLYGCETETPNWYLHGLFA